MALFGRKTEQDATLGKPPMGWGVPGVQKDESVDTEMEAMLQTAPAGQRRIGREENVVVFFFFCVFFYFFFFFIFLFCFFFVVFVSIRSFTVAATFSENRAVAN